MIARVLASLGLSCDPANPLVVSTCRDVLHLDHRRGKAEGAVAAEDLPAMLQAIWGPAVGRPLRPAAAIGRSARGARMTNAAP